MTDIYNAKNFSRVKAERCAPLRKVSDRDYILELKLPVYHDWKVGQFLMLLWGSHVIGRPFAILDWKKVSNTESRLKLWFRVLGSGTQELSEFLKKETEVFVTLPLGRVPEKLLNSQNILFISGGVGAATIWPMHRERKKQHQDFWVHGERDLTSLVSDISPDLVFLEEAPGSFQKGRVTRIFEDPALLKEKKLSDFEMIVACGPSPMLQALQKLSKENHLTCFMGLEEKMACGVGLCFSCSVKTQEGMQRCCLEGPWFEAQSISGHFEFRSGAVR